MREIVTLENNPEQNITNLPTLDRNSKGRGAIAGRGEALVLLSFSHQLCISVGCRLPESAFRYIEKSESSVLYPSLVDLLFLIHAQLAWTHVDQEKETAAARDVKKSK